MALASDSPDRLRAPDWRDKYRWPDPDQGWSGPLAGYPPDHPIRAGRPIPLHLIAQKYQQDEEVTRYQALGLIGSHIREKESPWTAPAGGDTPSPGADAPSPESGLIGSSLLMGGSSKGGAAMKRWRAANPEKAREQKRRYRARKRAKASAGS
jgi:hypothetical protein